MAVVFISPKQRQKVFFLGIISLAALFVIVVAFLVFLSKPEEIPAEIVWNKPKINIDIKVFDSEPFKALELFEDMQIQFKYTALNKKNKIMTGFVSATSLEEAKTILEGMGLAVSSLEEAEIGREDPFTPYYSSTNNASKTTTKTK